MKKAVSRNRDNLVPQAPHPQVGVITPGFTDSLIRLFANCNPLLNAARGAGLPALDVLPRARDFVAQRRVFGARGYYAAHPSGEP